MVTQGVLFSAPNCCINALSAIVFGSNLENYLLTIKFWVDDFRILLIDLLNMAIKYP
ncbi:MAG: hypothetical protein DHS20C17_10490 [Cyclobacteriaceae bacterium]|nr:MAG: hypothetical protein DHS20C17_10490 [Cyclobacteriaceae bacterium]